MRIKNVLFSRVLFSFAVLFLFLIQTKIIAQEKVFKIDELMKTYNSYGQFNGSVLVAENGKVVFKKGYGLANMEWNIPNEADTKFRLGSITKQFTSMLIMQLVEAGKIRLDNKISDYLLNYRKDIGEKVTIHHLLTHTSGIPGYTELPKFFEDVSRNPFTVDEFIKIYCSHDPEYEPGAKFKYSNSGYFILGAIIEKINGKTYEEALKDKIFNPLGMKSTGYDHYDEILNKRAAGYQKDVDYYVNAPYLDMSLPFSAGALYSTVEDLYIWDQALYSEKLLSQKYKEIMFKPYVNAFGGNYAYGWGIFEQSFGGIKKKIISHGGGINGFNTLIVRNVDDKHLIVLLNNTGGTRLNEMSTAIMNILYDKPYNMPKKSIADELFHIISEKDIESAIKSYKELKANSLNSYDFSEQELNNLGYRLLGIKKLKEAIEILKLNVEVYPNSSNVYDSLGEAYMANGEKELAIKNYEKSLELDPKNTGAVEALKKLREK